MEFQVIFCILLYLDTIGTGKGNEFEVFKVFIYLKLPVKNTKFVNFYFIFATLYELHCNFNNNNNNKEKKK